MSWSYGAHRVLPVVPIGLGFVVALGAPRASHAEPMSDADLAALDRGELVKHAHDPNLPGGGFLGGLSYAVVSAPPESVRSALRDASAYSRIFPLTIAAAEVGRVGDDRLVAITHGGRFGSVAYTTRVRESPDGTVRFWLDPTRPHDVDDAWGFFRVEPWTEGRTLLTYGAVVELGRGVAWLFFREKIRRHALETPRLVRRFVEERTRTSVAAR